MRLTKVQREQLRQMFGGRCAYCGCELSNGWHADHVESVQRDIHYVPGKGWVPNGKVLRPSRDVIENLMPACPPCNIDKHAMPLESWRQKLQGTCGVLNRNYPTYRHAYRFGLIKETGVQIVFYFERVQQEAVNEAG